MVRKFKKLPRRSPPEFFLLQFLTELCWLPFKWLNRKINKWLWRFCLPSLGQKSVTSFGLKVKSRAELRIAEFFHKNQVRFEYEKPVRVWLWKKVRPDFYLPDFEVYVEYEGLLNHRTRGRLYRRGVAYKRQRFAARGIQCWHFDHRHKHKLEDHLAQMLRKLRTKNS